MELRDLLLGLAHRVRRNGPELSLAVDRAGHRPVRPMPRVSFARAVTAGFARTGGSATTATLGAGLRQGPVPGAVRLGAGSNAWYSCGVGMMRSPACLYRMQTEILPYPSHSHNLKNLTCTRRGAILVMQWRNVILIPLGTFTGCSPHAENARAMTYRRPVALDDTLVILDARPHRILAGGTDVYPADAAAVGWGRPGVDHPGGAPILDITAVDELVGIRRLPDRVEIGARVTWTEAVESGLPRVVRLRAAGGPRGGGTADPEPRHRRRQPVQRVARGGRRARPARAERARALAAARRCARDPPRGISSPATGAPACSPTS